MNKNFNISIVWKSQINEINGYDYAGNFIKDTRLRT